MKLCLLVVLVLAQLALGADFHYFFHLSDLHMDKLYKPGTSRDKRCVDGEGDAPLVVTPDCDISYPAVKDFLEKLKAKYPSPDFILYTGDTAPHYVDYGYATPYTKEDVYECFKDGLDMMREVFPNATIYPIQGNHDNYPCDILPFNDEGKQHLSRLGDIYAEFIPSESAEMFRQHGYYTVDVDDKIRLIATTTDFWLPNNLYATMTGGEFDYNILDNFELELQKMREENKVGVWIGHHPLGHSETSYGDISILPIPWRRLEAILQEYSDVLSFGSFAGHTHKNSYRVILDNNKRPMANQFTTTSVGDYSNQNGGCNVFKFNPDTHTVEDMFMLYINTEESNAIGEIILEEFPPFVEDFGLPDLSPASLIELFRRNTSSKDGETIKKYAARLFTGTQPTTLTNSLWGAMACGSGPLDEDTYQECYASLSNGIPYVYPQ